MRAFASMAADRGHTLLVANHVSWLDILVLGGATGCAFVSKDELGHPFIHWLADQNATVYVKRSARKGAKDQAVAIARALEGDKPVALFPEGTTGPGTHLLPFRSTLLEAANFAAKDVAIRPVALDYGCGRCRSRLVATSRARTTCCGCSAGAGRCRSPFICSRRSTAPATASSSPSEARDAIAQRLGLTSAAHSPIGRGEMTPKTFKIKSFGCQMNVYDGERMAELLGAQGMTRGCRGARMPTSSSSTPATSARRRRRRPIRTSAA